MPFNEKGNQLALKKSESPIFRSLFSITSVLLLFLMPYLSFDYGITADEEVQQNYGELVLKYFESDGADGEALQYKPILVWWSFGFTWHGRRNIFSVLECSRGSHMFNALVGA